MITQESVAKVMAERNPSEERLKHGAHQFLTNDTVGFVVNALWAEYAHAETAALRNLSVGTEEATRIAESIRFKRLALEELLEDLSDLANYESADSQEETEAETSDIT